MMCHTLATAYLLIHDTLCLDCSDAAAVTQTIPCCIQRFFLKKEQKQKEELGPDNPITGYRAIL